jgi:PAS domain-containing protein
VLHNDDSQKGSQGHDREAVVNERTQLQDAKARLAAIVEGSEDAIIAYRLDGVITDWNQVCAPEQK